MKKFIAIALLALFATACTPTENVGMMNKGMMCEKCPCCQKMMESGMKDGMMKEGMQCPMMKSGASKDGMKCGCCQGMMKDGMEKQSAPAPKKPVGVSAEEHKQHHPEQ